MISVADRVIHAIEAYARGEFEFALEDAAVAVDISAQRYFKKTRSSKADYKAFLNHYLWLIELMALNGIDLQNSVFSNFTIPGVQVTGISDILYHVVRCGLVHSTGLPVNLAFTSGRHAVFAHEFIALPAQVIWGLLATVVFAKVNSQEVSRGDYFLSYEENRFPIRDYWGREDLIRPFYDKYVQVRVTLNMAPFDKL